ncbi:hypothetical protein [Ruminococcus sp.]
MMISPVIRYILLAIACVIMVSAIIWIGHLMFADLSKMIKKDDKEKEKTD